MSLLLVSEDLGVSKKIDGSFSDESSLVKNATEIFKGVITKDPCRRKTGCINLYFQDDLKDRPKKLINTLFYFIEEGDNLKIILLSNLKEIESINENVEEYVYLILPGKEGYERKSNTKYPDLLNEIIGNEYLKKCRELNIVDLGGGDGKYWLSCLEQYSINLKIIDDCKKNLYNGLDAKKIKETIFNRPLTEILSDNNFSEKQDIITEHSFLNLILCNSGSSRYNEINKLLKESHEILNENGLLILSNWRQMGPYDARYKRKQNPEYCLNTPELDPRNVGFNLEKIYDFHLIFNEVWDSYSMERIYLFRKK